MSEVVLPPIPVGTIFYVPIGEVHVMGLVHAAATIPSAAGVVYVQVVGPPLQREGWKPEFDSWWLVDDLALRDGSWRTQPPRASFAPAPLQRFAGMNGEQPVLLTIAPDTLTLANLANADSPEERAEWDAAPKLASPVPSAFEADVARVMRLPEPHRYRDDNENASRYAVTLARIDNDDPDATLSFDFAINYAERSTADSAASSIDAPTYVESLDDGTAVLTISDDIVPAYPRVAPYIERRRNFAEHTGGTFDGFGAWHRGWSAERARREAAE